MTQLLRSAADAVRGGRRHGAHVESNRFEDCLRLQRHTSTHTYSPLKPLHTRSNSAKHFQTCHTARSVLHTQTSEPQSATHTRLLDKTAQLWETSVKSLALGHKRPPILTELILSLYLHIHNANHLHINLWLFIMKLWRYWREGAMHAGNDACWARGILGGCFPAGLASEIAAWLMALSWQGHKSFCLCLIQPMVHRAGRECGTQCFTSFP